jgi:hypothetical protein
MVFFSVFLSFSVCLFHQFYRLLDPERAAADVVLIKNRLLQSRSLCIDSCFLYAKGWLVL